ncbi:hypothetical protein BCR37DRAFT_391594 [Protomyces lactucae-debilis]|uniref:Uncharacterized protein n=1 Tax=Protomyces lactucae-debilis TaxID=2754530 RepID=A0A1Y2FNB6_PROLT|nr:uncharacterized protein BCR37DRAFT_391594 [Protomyces lactucae-debilis]ORY84834.1 hypothetical protein BCR37DRAFT_391594 [Protomyces lactucae-debilis]
MLARESTSSSNSSVYGFDADFEVCEGEMLDYDESQDTEPVAIDFGNPFTCTSPLETLFEARSVQASPFAVQGAFDTPGKGKGKAVSGLTAQASAATAAATATVSYADRDQYHPESARQEIVEQIMTRGAGLSGQIAAKTLQHSSEQWSNYADVCRSVAEVLRVQGFPNALVESVRYGSERQIVYEL